MNTRVLVVEDETDLAQILVDYLKRDGFAASTQADGLLAMKELLRSLPDLLLLDLMLPGMDGLAILRELRKISAIPVIVVTAKVEEIDRLLGLELGADDYICKPYSPREVVARVKAVLRRAQNAPPSPGWWCLQLRQRPKLGLPASRIMAASWCRQLARSVCPEGLRMDSMARMLPSWVRLLLGGNTSRIFSPQVTRPTGSC